jgi:hypothetical protein
MPKQTIKGIEFECHPLTLTCLFCGETACAEMTEFDKAMYNTRLAVEMLESE